MWSAGSSLWVPGTVAGGGGGAPGFQTLTDGATVNWDLSAGSAQVTLGGDRTIANPTNMQAGEVYFLLVKQDATGTRRPTWGTAYWWEGGAPPVLSTWPNYADLLTFACDGSHLILVSARYNLKQYTPTTADSFANLIAWYDATQIAGLASGDAVTTWANAKSPGTYDMASAGSGSAITYVTNVQNARPVVRGPGAWRYMEASGMGAAFTSQATLVLVHRRLGGYTGTGGLARFDTAADWYHSFGGGAGYWGYLRSARLEAHPTTSEFNFTANASITIIRSGPSGGYRVRQNGTDKYATTASFGMATNPQLFAGPNGYYDGDLCEVAAYSRELSDSEVASLETALNAKWAVY